MAFSCSSDSSYIQTPAQLKGGKTFAVPTGTVADQMVLKHYPDAKITYYNSVFDCALAVKNGKADAAVYDKPVLLNIAGKNDGLRVLGELLEPDFYGFAVALGNDTIKSAADNTLAELKANGTYDEMQKRWFPSRGQPGPMPDLPDYGGPGVLRFGTASVTEPMSFVDSTMRVIGFDIEFAARIAASLNRRLEVVDMEFGAMIPALISGKVDMIGAGLSITEERAKSVLFTESYYESGIAVLVKAPSGIPQDTESGQAAPSAGEEWFATGNLGVLMGSIHDGYAHKHYPLANILPYNTVPDMLLALSSGKVDAIFVDQTAVREIFSRNPHFAVGKEDVMTVDMGAGFRKRDTELRNAFNEFLAAIRADGTYAGMEERWMVQENASMPVIPNPNPSGTLRAGVVSDIGLPFAARSDQELKGFDIELSTRFAAWVNRQIVFTDLPFGSLIPSLASDKIDIITASMMITEERKKEIDFSDPYYASGTAILIRESDKPAVVNGRMKVLDDIRGKKVAIFSGTVHDAFLEREYPEAKISRLESTADMIISLKSGKVDAAMLDRITAGLILKRNPEIGVLSEDALDMPLGVGFNKNNPALLAEFNTFLREIRNDGTYDEMTGRWFIGDAEEAVMPAFPANPGGKRLVAGVAVEDLPYVAWMNGDYTGFDIEMIRRFAQRNNYNVEFVTIEFPALVAALASGKVDMIADGIAISEERAKQINFSDSYAMFKTAVIALKNNLDSYTDYSGPEEKPASFLSRLAGSFENNILRENRYMLILRGLWITVLISIFAAIAGTILGGIICYMRMSKNLLLNQTAGSFISLIRGTPVLVLLMITYYVIFASVNINPVLVAILAFGVNFGAYVSEMFRTSIESIDRGQKEAGIASGFTRIQTFVHIILPQALRRVLPVYKGEFISLVKMTSVVGYIAVQDLTKASDIIRSRTFDAFFPLIMAAVIYIIIAWLLTLVLGYIEVNVDPKRRNLKIGKELLP